MTRQPRRWPLTFIAAPAAVAVWSGWVGLGTLCGFGIVHPLPGILDSFQINTAITLPVGVEAYGAYALGAWLSPAGVPAGARRFARASAVGALALGMLGQVVYHLLAAAHAARAPWPVVVLVACLPVVTLGFGAGLTHLLRLPESAPEPGEDLAEPETAAGPAPEPEQDAGPAPALVQADVTEIVADAESAARVALARSIAGGNPLTQNALQERFRLTRSQAQRVRQSVLAASNGHAAEEVATDD